MALSAASVQAAPLAPPRATSAELGSAPPIEPVRDGCGYGYYRTRWQDQWGYWALGPLRSEVVGRGGFQQQREW